MVRKTEEYRNDEEGSGAAPRLTDEAYCYQMMQQVRDYAMFIVDPNGHILMWNQGAAHMMGYSPEEIIGKRLDVLHMLNVVVSRVSSTTRPARC